MNREIAYWGYQDDVYDGRIVQVITLTIGHAVYKTTIFLEESVLQDKLQAFLDQRPQISEAEYDRLLIMTSTEVPMGTAVSLLAESFFAPLFFNVDYQRPLF